jgi:hypothetical protein
MNDKLIDSVLSLLGYTRNQVEILTPDDPKVLELAKELKRKKEEAMGVCLN